MTTFQVLGLEDPDTTPKLTRVWGVRKDDTLDRLMLLLIDKEEARSIALEAKVEGEFPDIEVDDKYLAYVLPVNEKVKMLTVDSIRKEKQ